MLKQEYTYFKKGIHAGISIAIGYAPAALTFGLLAKTTGLHLYETAMMSFIIYAGAAQYIALQMFALGISAIEMILTVFIVNIRHFLMSASLNEKAEKDRFIKKAIYAFGVTDETFSVAATEKGELKTNFIFGLNFISYMSWGVFSLIGYAVGASLPQVLQESMTIALYAMFIGLLIPSVKKSLKVTLLAVLAAIFNSCFVFSELLSNGWAIILSTLLSAILVEFIESIKKRGAVSS